jgi:hypothetical protein
MASLVCLTIAAVCAIISRILLLIAALNISVWWAVGVFFPFGPTLFRLTYPQQARSSFIFRVATLGCVFLYVVLGPAALIGTTNRFSHRSHPPHGYASEIAPKLLPAGSANKIKTPNLQERCAANARELQRLARWSEALRLEKRDLLRSDVEGNRVYNLNLQEYNAALAAAKAEKQLLAAAVTKQP